MRQSRFYISLYIIIPFIITGLTVLAAILSFRLTKYGLAGGSDPAQPVFWLIFVLGAIAFATGFVLVRFILKPVERFVEKARKLATISGEKTDTDKSWSLDQIDQFASVFDRVTSVLSRMDARHFFPDIIGESLAMRGLLGLIKKVAPSDSTVLILGESGTGKELVATSIFQNSDRHNKPFIKLNCAAIPEELLESELFGHEKGAFTGATKFKPGKFDMANQGTIFLDEIGDMPLNLQSKILRVLQEKEFYRVGGSSTIMHYDGSSWQLQANDADSSLTGIWSDGPDTAEAAAGGRLSPLAVEALINSCDCSALAFDDTAELQPRETPLRQERVLEAVEFANGIARSGYNLYVMGSAGVGKHRLLKGLLADCAAEQPPASDWCHVADFSNPDLADAPRMRLGKMEGAAVLGLSLGPGLKVRHVSSLLAESMNRSAARASLDIKLQKEKTAVVTPVEIRGIRQGWH